MHYEEAVDYLDRLGIDAMRGLAPSLHRIEALCAALAHPERSAPAIHIAGTNGKTSVARIVTALLGAAGLKVATFSSPHLENVRERLSLAGVPISEEDFAGAFTHLFPYIETVEAELDEKLSYFEVLTGLFFLWAAEAPVDALVVEVGLGGRWDATNVVPSSVQVLTNVALDHTDLLGSDRIAIAREKSGIIGPEGIVVTGERAPDVLQVIRTAANDAGAAVAAIGSDFEVEENNVAVGGRYLGLRSSVRSYEGAFLPLHGAHQGVNAAVALEAVTAFLPARELDPEIVIQGLASVTAPGRLEVVRQGTDVAPAVLVDVAHNPDGMSASVSALAEGFAFEHLTFVFGVLSDKDHVGMLTELTRIPARVVVTSPASPRARSAEEVGAAAQQVGLQAEVVPDARDAIATALGASGPGDLVCIIGSHYLVGEARQMFEDSSAGSA